MSSKKIEYLADRRPARKGSDKTLRALRHLDAARAKLEVLMAIRRELKSELVLVREQKQAALNRVAELEAQVELQLGDIDALQSLLDEQAETLSRLRPGTPRPGFDGHDDDHPALTVLAVEKAASRSDADIENEAVKPARSRGLLGRLWRSPAPDADQSD